jgi:hypothetical protein
LKFIKDAFINNKGQDMVGKLLFNLVANQLEDEIYFDKGKSQIFLNNKAEVNEIIKIALQQKIINATLKYFDTVVYLQRKNETEFLKK